MISIHLADSDVYFNPKKFAVAFTIGFMFAFSIFLLSRIELGKLIIGVEIKDTALYIRKLSFYHFSREAQPSELTKILILPREVDKHKLSFKNTIYTKFFDDLALESINKYADSNIKK